MEERAFTHSIFSIIAEIFNPGEQKKGELHLLCAFWTSNWDDVLLPFPTVDV